MVSRRPLFLVLIFLQCGHLNVAALAPTVTVWLQYGQFPVCVPEMLFIPTPIKKNPPMMAKIPIIIVIIGIPARMHIAPTAIHKVPMVGFFFTSDKSLLRILGSSFFTNVNPQLGQLSALSDISLEQKRPYTNTETTIYMYESIFILVCPII